jgi:hypothetical protein
MINVQLLRDTLAHIEAHPETWDQATYRCGSSMCFAGWAAELDGCVWATSGLEYSDDNEFVKARESDPESETFANGTIHVHDRAQAALGLTGDQAEYLFGGGNEIGHLRHIVAELIGEATP